MAKDFQIYRKFRGFETHEDTTNIENQRHAVLVRGSQNVEITRKGTLAPRNAITKSGPFEPMVRDSEGGRRELLPFNWTTSSNEELIITAGRLVGNSAKSILYYKSNQWNPLLYKNGVNELNAVDTQFAEWWDSNTQRDILLMVDGGERICSWSGAFAEVFDYNNSATIDVIAPQEKNFRVGDTVRIGSNEYTITALGNNEITLNSDPGDVTGQVIQGVVEETTTFTWTFAGTNNTGNLSDTFGFDFDVIGVFQNQIHVGDRNGQRIFISRNDNFADFSFTGTRTIGEGDTLLVPDSPDSFIVNEAGDAMLMSGRKRGVFEIDELVDDTSLDAYFKVTSLIDDPDAGLLHPNAYVKTPYGTFYISKNVEVRRLARIDKEDTTTTEALSRKIEDYLDAGSEELTIEYKDRVLYIADGSGVMRYEFTLGLWQPPITHIDLSDVVVFQRSGDITLMNSNGTQYKISDQPGADRINDDFQTVTPVEQKAIFNIEDYNERDKRKVVSQFFMDGSYASNMFESDSHIDCAIVYDYGGQAIANQDQDGSLKYLYDFFPVKDSETGVEFWSADGVDDDLVPGSTENLGQFYGSEEDYRFKVFKDLPRREFYSVQVQLQSNTEQSAWDLTSFGFNVRISKRNANRGGQAITIS